jgi:hypothetical protein
MKPKIKDILNSIINNLNSKNSKIREDCNREIDEYIIIGNEKNIN